jgi:hypothetical protein
MTTRNREQVVHEAGAPAEDTLMEPLVRAGDPITIIRATVRPPVQLAASVVLYTGRAISVRLPVASPWEQDEHVVMAISTAGGRKVTKGRLEAIRGVIAVMSIAGAWRAFDLQASQLHRVEIPVVLHGKGNRHGEGLAIDFSPSGISVAAQHPPEGDLAELELSVFGFSARVPVLIVKRDLSSEPPILHCQWDEERLLGPHVAFIRNVGRQLEELAEEKSRAA